MNEKLIFVGYMYTLSKLEIHVATIATVIKWRNSELLKSLERQMYETV